MVNFTLFQTILILSIISISFSLMLLAIYQPFNYTFNVSGYEAKILQDFFFQGQNQHGPKQDPVKAAIKKCKRRLLEEGFEKPLQMVTRNFNRSNPVRIYNNRGGGTVDFPCSVPCFLHTPMAVQGRQNEKADATFEKLPSNIRSALKVFSIYRTMESATNMPLSQFDKARAQYDIVMTPNLRTHVPTPYFSWVIFDFMRPVMFPQKLDSQYLSSAFISNCVARNFRLQAVTSFIDNGIPTNFHGKCSASVAPIGPNSPTQWKGRKDGNKDETMAKYKFHFAFENSQEEDYVTEKFFSALVVGTVPVVIGAPNIADFAPSDNSIFVVTSLDDVEPVAKMMKALSLNETEYQKKLAWKQDGPSDRFKALVDLSVVHSSCRLCVHVADRIRKQEMCDLLVDPSLDESCGYDFSSVVDDNDAQLVYMMKNGRPVKVKMEKEVRPLRIGDEIKVKESQNKSGKIDLFCSCNAIKFDLHLLQVRERGQFEFEPIFLQSDQLTVDDLTREILVHFIHIKYKPIWTKERDQNGRQPAKMKSNHVELKIYKIYPVGASQRAALFGDAAIDKDFKLINFVKNRPCGLIEVIFV